MNTKQKPKPRRLIVGAIYSVESFDGVASIWQVYRWTKDGWRDARGKKPALPQNWKPERVTLNNAPPEWQAALLREYARKLERAGDEMAKWFPFSSTHMKRVVGAWTEVRRAKP